jgi:hypothetical protein
MVLPTAILKPGNDVGGNELLKPTTVVATSHGEAHVSVGTDVIWNSGGIDHETRPERTPGSSTKYG